VELKKIQKNQVMRKIKVIISGGGTGGHIFPAVAIANAIKKRFPDADILFVGAEGKMEMEKVPAAGYPIEGLWISGLQRKLTIKNLAFPFKVLASLYKANKIVNRFQPDVVVGVGGYASGPLLRVATWKNIPTLIQEQNSYPGITNKMLASKVNKICVAYNNMERFFPKEKIIVTGNPVRQDITQLEGKKARGLEHFGLNENQPILLVIGGSLGARTINLSIEKILKIITDNNIQLVWQTGKAFYEQAVQSAAPFKDKVKVYDFISKMDYAYAVADMIVSRAGALSVSEICLTGKASILIPSPNVAEDHQTKNAMALVNYNAAILVKDKDAQETLGRNIIDLFKNENERLKLETNCLKLAYRDAADIIANEVITLIK
jgi:UDP-N-acetylglucosamine--N-acetylmuramyl-(pentapeptide) pyrophosphoryl-undecaprenol N-acetylglucosamine transferase